MTTSLQTVPRRVPASHELAWLAELAVGADGTATLTALIVNGKRIQ